MGEAEELFRRLERDASAGGYILNPNREDTMTLVEGLLTNIKRYGYPSCPCRIADGRRELDLDIICPCDYRDADLSDYGACYCALYVTRDWIEGRIERRVVPERRPPRERRVGPAGAGSGRNAAKGEPGGELSTTPITPASGGKAGEEVYASGAADMPSRLKGGYPVWRCRVCGYLCARERPPQVCPICRATADRFERFV